jgi:hypothetical protein
VRRQAGVMQYRVRWAGYSAADNTWEPRENLPASLIAEYHTSRIGSREETDNDDDSDECASSGSGVATAPANRKRQKSQVGQKKRATAPSSIAASVPASAPKRAPSAPSRPSM